MVSREIIAKFERVAIEEDKDAEGGVVSEPVSDNTPYIDEEEINEEEGEDNPFK